MRKIILLLLLVPNMVLASTVYTEYEPYILNTNQYIEETDILKREEVKLYNTYKEDIIEEKYMQLNNSSDYRIDNDDYIYEYKYSIEPNEYIYEYNTKCLNRNYLPRYMELKEFSNQFIIKHAEIITEQINEYKLEINPTELYLDNYIIYPNSTIYFNFFKNINILNFKIKLYLPIQNIENISFKIEFLPYSFINDFKLLTNKENIINIHFDNNYYQFLKDNNFVTPNKCISYYTLRIPLYKHYKINKINLNNYIPLNNNDLFIMEDYKINYNYYKRDKIELNDSIILKNTKFNLENFIVSSTIPIEELKVIDNINYEDEGDYNIDIYYKNDLLISKEVKYIKKNITETQKNENNNPIINQEINSTSKKSITTTTSKKKITTDKIKKMKVTTTEKTKVPTTIVKKINNRIVNSVKENRYQKPVFIIVISALLIILVTFECILLYVKKKYY